MNPPRKPKATTRKSSSFHARPDVSLPPPEFFIYSLTSTWKDTEAIEPGYLALDNPANERPDWGNYWPIRKFLLDNRLRENAYYGFFDATFKEKTGLSFSEVQNFALSAPESVQVVTFSPLHRQAVFYPNLFYGLDHVDPGFMAICQGFLDGLGMDVRLDRLTMNARAAAHDTCFVARRTFWRDWLTLCEKLFSVAESTKTDLSRDLTLPVPAKGIQRKVLVIESMASLLLTLRKDIRVTAYDPFKMVCPPELQAFTREAIVCDALKTAFADNRFPEYAQTFDSVSRFALSKINHHPSSADSAKAAAPDALSGPQPAINAASPTEPNPASPDVPAQPRHDPGSLSLIELMSETDALARAFKHDDAIALYQEWLKQTQSPQAFVAYFNLGYMLSNRGDLQGAQENYQFALQQNPNFLQARLNLGSVFERLGRKDDAIAQWEQAVADLAKDPKGDLSLTLHALNNLGRLLEDLRRYPEAEAKLTRSLALKHDQPDVIHHWVHLRQKQCEWPVYSPLPGIPTETMIAATSALATLSASNDPARQLEVALKYAREKVRSDLPRLAPDGGYAHDRLRIAYLSSNFGLHAVSLLTAELYELHDRSRVEVWGFCWSPEDNSGMRERVIHAMDHFVRIDRMTDEEAAREIRAAEIDILIDLQGLTSGCRANILSHRPAPVQMTYLGFPGTTGLPGIDYVLADKYVIPEAMAQYFSEKPLYLPDCFQVNDRKRTAGPVTTRNHYGLADDSFVFCAFNHNHKFSPELFAAWISILRRTPNSVLWLLADNERAHANMTQHAEQNGVDKSRLVFAPRVPPAEYLARFQLADLFLDTLPFNGGTTASDALWVGLPLLTCSGRTFASRMAGSLLHAIGVPELITTTLPDYEELAVSLVKDRERLGELRGRIEANRHTHPLFDTPRFVRALEDIFEQVALRP